MRFTFRSFLIRWVIAIVLVLATFNPTQYSLVSWLFSEPYDADIPLKALLFIVLVIAYVIFVRATLRSIGPIGIGLIVVLFGALGWVVVTYGGIEAIDTTIIVWLALLVVATILAIGLSWSHIRRRLTGQYDVDDTTEM